MLQKINAMDPNNKAILNTILADRAFAQNEMAKRIATMGMASVQDARTKELGLKKRRFDELAAFRDRDVGTAEKLALGNVALSGLLGYQGMKRKKALAMKYSNPQFLLDL
jgi:hypothetical protein